jgi:hypothetical protein
MDILADSELTGIVVLSVTESEIGSKVWCLRMYFIMFSAFQPSSSAMIAQSS